MKKVNLPGITKYKNLNEAFKDIAKQCDAIHNKTVDQMKALQPKPGGLNK